MSKTEPKLPEISQRKRALKLEDTVNDTTAKVASMEKAIHDLALLCQDAFGQQLESVKQLEAELYSVRLTAQAITNVVGQEAVQKEIDKLRAEAAEAAKEQARKNAEATKDAITKAVEEGNLKAVETISQTSLVTGRNLTKEGEVIEPGFFSERITSFKQTWREKLDSKPVGFIAEDEDGNRFEVLGIYEFVQKPSETPNQPAATA